MNEQKKNNTINIMVGFNQNNCVQRLLDAHTYSLYLHT